MVKTAGGDLKDLLAFRPDDTADKAVLVRNSAGPPSRKVPFEGSGLPIPSKGDRRTSLITAFSRRETFRSAAIQY